MQLTNFEKATLEQLISYKCRDIADLERMIADPKNIAEAKRLCLKWNATRKSKKLKQYK